MRIGILGWAAGQLEKRWNTRFPILVDFIVLFLDVSLYAFIVQAVTDFMKLAP